MKNTDRRHNLVSVSQIVGAAIAVCLLLGSDNACRSTDRVPVPSASELKAAQSEIKELFKADLGGAKSGAQLTEVAERMLTNVQNEASSRVNDYVLLTQAQATAIKASNISLSLKIVSLLAARYEFDEPQLTLQTLKDLAKGPADQDFHQQLADLALQLGSESQRADRLELAGQYLDLVVSLATRLKSPDLAKQTSARRANLTELKKLSEKLLAARKTLEKNAQDAAANDTVGRYLLLAQSDWMQALPLLALSQDSSLKSVAASDWKAISSDSTLSGDEAFQLAGDWWDQSQKQTQPGLKAAFKLRAGQWYEFALPHLKALTKIKAEQRLAESEWKSNAQLLPLMPLNFQAAQLQATLAGMHGWLGPESVICQSAKFEEALELTKTLAAKRFRPTRFRPYPTPDGLKVAAIWRRDGIEGDVFVGTAEQVLKHDLANRSKGLVPVDVAGYLPPDSQGAVWHVLVSARQVVADGQKISLSLDAEAKGEVERCKEAKVIPLTFQRYLGADNALRTDMVRHRVGVRDWTLRAGPLTWMLGQIKPQTGILTDVGVVIDGGQKAQFISAFQRVEGVTDHEGHSENLAENIPAWTKLAADKASPVAIGVSVTPDGRYQSMWVWHRPK